MDKHFWRGCFERALKTFFQTFIATLGVGVGVVYTAAVAAILSVATSLGSPSFVAGNHPRFPDLASEDPELIAAALDVPADDPGMIEPADDTAPTDDETGSVAVARHAEV